MGANCCKEDGYAKEVESLDVTVQVQTPQGKMSTPQSAKTSDSVEFGRRQAAGAVAAQLVDNVHIPSMKKDPNTLRILDNAVKGNLLFDKLTAHTKMLVFDSMLPLEVLPGTTIIQQGDTEASKFYILEQGYCDVLLKKPDDTAAKVVHHYKSGSAFGELALLYDQPRAATVKATAKCKLWVMERDVYNAVYRRAVQTVQNEKRELVEGLPIFKPLSDELRSVLCDALHYEEFAANSTIFYKGDEGHKLYLIKDGSVNVTSGDKVLAKLGPGQYFGDRALRRQNAPRAATVTTTSFCVCYTLERKQFQNLLGPLEDAWRFEALKQVPILYNLTDMQLLQLASHMTSRDVEEGQVIITQGEQGDTFYVIEEGIFKCYKDDGTALALIGKGSCFGELALLHDEQRACNVAVKNKGRLLSLDRAAFKRLLGDLSQLRHVWRFEALRRVPLLASLSNDVKARMCSALKQQSYPAKSQIVAQGEVGTKFFIVEAGLLAVFKDGKPVMRLSPGQYFGELALLRDEPRAATVVAQTNVTLLEMEKEDFQSTMNSLNQYFADKAKVNYGMAGIHEGEVKLDDLKQVGILGQGAFGKVWMVQWKERYYALKKISKAQVVKSNLITHVKTEKRLMAECDSPFLVNLKASFQDEMQLYMLMEFVQGGELFSFMRKRKRAFRESWAKFYAAAVICAFEYLGARNIVYRDLKPENLLIDSNGYLKVTDFGFAKKLAPGSKTYTLCGTPEYLAPEVILQEGHNRAADWWTLGILIFELVAGLPPFYDQDRVKMFKKCVSGNINYPSHMSKECADLVSKLLTTKPAARLGMQRGGARDIKEHPWFEGFDWRAFEARKMAAPYIPVIKNPSDLRNFSPAKMDNNVESYKSVGQFHDF